MRIDLHCHTKAIKKGDGIGRNVTPELFKTKIEDADIKIVAITNHNAFDFEQYHILSEIVKDTCQVWPGVEIDVLEPDSKRWHLIVVANPKEAESFANSVSSLFQDDNLEDCTHTLEEIYSAFSCHDAIYITHFHKSPAVPADDGNKLDQLVGEPHRVFKETSNNNSMSVFANYRYNVLVGSDVKDWANYEKCSFAELKLPVDSFEQFCLLAMRDENVVQTLMNNKDSKTLIAHPAANVNLPIQLFADTNIIFGQKGTGKTQIIKTLCESMRASGLKCVSYIATEREDDFKSLLGHNGSGKSTLAKHINAILAPTEGTLWVDGKDAGDRGNVWDIRQSAGMVFQNPDNQIVGTLVDEEVGFGPENIGIPTEEIWERVEKSLKAVGMYAFRNQSPNKLSGGQKQRVAIAGIVAMKPKCIVLDEPTAMLDPLGRKDVLNVLHELNRQENVTVILITHYMEEVIDIDKLYVMDDGKLVMSGTPREIFSQVEKLKKLRLDVPHVTELAYELQKEGVPLKNGILTSEEFTEELIRVRNEGFNVNNSR